MNTTLTLEERKILELPGRPEWATPAVAAELRHIVKEIEAGGAAIASHDDQTAKHRQRQREIRERIFALENPNEFPDEASGLELSKLQSYAVQVAAFMGSADARRSALVVKVMAGIKKLTGQLQRLTRRDLWCIENPNPQHLSTIHILCASLVEGSLKGEFEAGEPSPVFPTLFTPNTIGNQPFPR